MAKKRVISKANEVFKVVSGMAKLANQFPKSWGKIYPAFLALAEKYQYHKE